MRFAAIYLPAFLAHAMPCTHSQPASQPACAPVGLNECPATALPATSLPADTAPSLPPFMPSTCQNTRTSRQDPKEHERSGEAVSADERDVFGVVHNERRSRERDGGVGNADALRRRRGAGGRAGAQHGHPRSGGGGVALAEAAWALHWPALAAWRVCI